MPTASRSRPEAAGPSPGRETANGDGARSLDDSRLTTLVGYAASRAALELRHAFEQHLGHLGLKVVDYSILVLVASNANVNQKQLGQALDISAPNMAITLDRLVERGWVERVRSTQDRRAMWIHLTAAGRVLVDQALGIAATMEDGVLRGLTSAERALLVELLLKVVRRRRPPAA